MIFLLTALTLSVNVIEISGRTRPKVIYNNDQGYVYPHGGCDGDNPQGMVHFLFYSNEIDIQAIIASGSTNCASPGTNINEAYKIIDLYAQDYNTLSSHLPDFPTADALRAITYQGCNHSAPEAGYPPHSLQASNKIISIVDSLADGEYVWYGAGAGLCELARALHDKPSIVSKIAVYSIGSWNTDQDPYARDYIFKNYPDLFWIESNGTFGAWFSGGNQSGIYNSITYDTQIIGESSSKLAQYYKTIIPSQYKSPAFQEGDGPAYFYVIDPNNADRNMMDPTQPNWGGQYSPPYSNRPKFYSDDWNHYGGDSIHRWRTNYLDDWKYRLDSWF